MAVGVSSNNFQARPGYGDLDALIQAIPAYAGRQYVKEPFIYTVDFANLASGGTRGNNVMIDGDSDFLCTDFQSWAVEPGHAAPYTANDYIVPDVRMQVQRNGGKLLFYAPIPIPSVSGQVGIIMPLMAPYVFPSNSTINVQLTNLEAVTLDVSIQFRGVKIYTY